MNELSLRLQKVRQIIAEKQADACIVTSPVNQYWLCGEVFNGFLFLYPEGEPWLFVKRPACAASERVKPIRKPEQIPGFLRDLPKRILIEADQLSFSAANRLQAALGMPETDNVSGELRKMRSIKSEYELEQIRESARIHAQVYELIPSLYRKGMTDLALQIEIERQMRLHGSAGILRAFGENMDVFMGSLLAGDNAQAASPYDYALGGAGVTPLLPLGANGAPLEPGTTVMVDMAGNYRPWMDDLTRTFAVEYAPDAAHKAHQVSIDIHEAVAKSFRAGVPCSELYLLAEEIVKENGLASCFMGTVQQARFVGHGVGLEINEPPVLSAASKEVLEPGMAFALEPKFVLPGIGAVGIENTYIVHASGLEKVTILEENITVLS